MTIKQQILNTISNHIDKQTEKGMNTYGQSLDDCPINKYDWQQMIIEELIDALQYQQKEITRIKKNGSMSLEVLTDLIVDWSIEHDLNIEDSIKKFLIVSDVFIHNGTRLNY